MDMLRVEELLSAVMEGHGRNPQGYALEGVSSPVYRGGEVVLACAHVHTSHTGNLCQCDGRVVSAASLGADVHTFRWPAVGYSFKYILVCGSCLDAAQGDVSKVEVKVGGAIQLLN